MKTKLLLLSLMTSVLWCKAQNRVNAMNNEISDNLDLRAVADILEIQEILGI
jgi:hypothetical protein